jgi:hypothetical protein
MYGLFTFFSMKKLIHTIVFLFIQLLAMSQSQIEITGIVIDNSTGKPLSYANIQIKGTLNGTISDIHGEFLLRLQNVYPNDTLCIAYLGYKIFKYPLNNGQPKPIIAQLEPKPKQLSTVNVHAASALELLKQAIREIPNNYPCRPYWTECSFLEFRKEDSTTLYHTEAQILMKKAGYLTSSNQDSAELRKGSARNAIPAIRNSLYFVHLLSGPFDLVRSKRHFLDKSQFKYYDFHLDDNIEYKGRPVYVILFDQKEGLQKALFKGKIYIECESLAFVKIEFGTSEKGLKYAAHPFIWNAMLKLFIDCTEHPYIKHQVCDYEQVQGKWALSYIQYESINTRTFYDNFASCYYRTWAEMAISNIDTNMRANYLDKTHLILKHSFLENDSTKPHKVLWKNHGFQVEKRLLHLLPDSILENEEK